MAMKGKKPNAVPEAKTNPARWRQLGDVRINWAGLQPQKKTAKPSPQADSLMLRKRSAKQKTIFQSSLNKMGEDDMKDALQQAEDDMS